MTITIPNVGETVMLDNIVGNVAAGNWQVRLYTAATISEGMTIANITEATFAGYSTTADGVANLITAGTEWNAAVAGDPSSATSTQTTTFTRSTTGAAQTILGYYVTNAGNTEMVYIDSAPSSITVTNSGDAISVTLALTLQDTQD